MKLLKRFIALTLSCFMLTGCTLTERLGSPDSSQTDNVIKNENLANYFGLTYYSGENINPVSVKTDMNRVLVDALYEGMIYLDDNFKPQPMLCENWEGDGTTFRFYIKQGVTFWSGEPLTANDVVYTLKTAQRDTQSLYNTRMADIDSIYADNEYTVVVTLKAPNVNLPSLMDIPIFRANTEDLTFSDGTGAYKPVQENGTWYLTPYENWHGGKVSEFDKISLVNTTRSDAVQHSFETGDISLMRTERIGTDSVTVSGSVDIYKLPTTDMHFLGFANNIEPFSIPAVRQAISLAIDRNGICSTQLQSFAEPAVLPVNPQPEGQNTALDRAAAIQTLAASGIVDNNGDGILEYQSAYGYLASLTTSILVNSENPFKVAAANQIAASLTAIGIKTSVEEVTFEEYQNRVSTGNFQMYYGEIRMTPDFDLRSLIMTGGALNYGRYSNAQTDQLVINARTSELEDAKTQLYNYLLAEMPIIPIAFAKDQVIVRSNLIKGFSPSPNWIFHGVGGWRKN